MRAAFAVLLAIGLAGCSTNGPGLLQSSQPTASASPTTQPNQPGQQLPGRVAIAQVVGAPDNVEREIVGSLTRSLAAKGVGVAQSANAGAEFTLRGYVVAARESNGTKVSYIWDVYNRTDQRVNRITGEEVISGAGAGDPWASVSGQIVNTISAKTATSLAAWLPSQSGAAATPVANTIAPSSNVRTAAVTNPSQPVAQSPGASRSAATSGDGQLRAVVPRVTGAPGDGATALSRALQKELTRNGISVTQAASPDAYQVQGRVVIGPGSGGKQPIAIDWIVKNAQGLELGTVSQKNEIPAGSLNGRWGGTADAAAAAATQGILELLRAQKSNGSRKS